MLASSLEVSDRMLVDDRVCSWWVAEDCRRRRRCNSLNREGAAWNVYLVCGAYIASRTRQRHKVVVSPLHKLTLNGRTRRGTLPISRNRCLDYA